MKKVQGRAATVIPSAQITTKINSVVTVGKEELTGAEATRAGLILDAFKGSRSLFTNPFVRKVFFPNYPLHTLKWPELPTTQPQISFACRELNKSQRKAVEKCLSNKETDRHVVIVVSSTSSFYILISRWVSGAARDWKDHCHCRHCSEQGRRARIEYGLGDRTVKCRSQERCGEIGWFRFFGLQASRLNGVPFRLVSSSGCEAHPLTRTELSKARASVHGHQTQYDRIR